VNDTALAVVVFEGTTMKLKFAVCPASVELLEGDADTLKSSTTKVTGKVVPPPGVGLFTETFSVPPCAESFASRAAFSDVELTNVVARELPLIRTVEVVLKFAPVTLRLTAPAPADTVDGETLFSPGTGLFTVNVVTTDGSPPGFATVTNGVPATAMALAGIAACNCVALTNADETTLKLNVTTEPAVKPFPASVSVNAGPPAVVLAGTSPPTTGCVFAGRIVSGKDGVVPPWLPFPLGLVTEMLIVPELAISPAEIAMLSCVPLTSVVSRGVPLKFTTAPIAKFAPFAVSVKPGPPSTALGGLKDEIVAGGPKTLNA
jgi:hypothetical protein